jgi:hypothetical protein
MGGACRRVRDLPMTMIKNEHIVWAYAEREDGKGQVLIVGLTPTGIDYMKATFGQTLVINPPGRGFSNVTQVIVFTAASKAELKDILRQSGVTVSEVN